MMALLLLIDEDRDSCYLAKRILSREGHVAKAFTGTKEALEWLRNNLPDFAVISAGKHGQQARKMLEALRGAGMEGRRIILSAETGDLGAVRRTFSDFVFEVIEKGNGFEKLLEVLRAGKLG
jgi:DNA-binding NtrC family response regulator